MSIKNGDSPDQQPVATLHQMLIVFNDGTGQLQVQGVPANKVVALGMLRFAEHVVLAMNQQQPKASPIIGLPPGVKLL